MWRWQYLPIGPLFGSLALLTFLFSQFILPGFNVLLDTPGLCSIIYSTQLGSAARRPYLLKLSFLYQPLDVSTRAELARSKLHGNPSGRNLHIRDISLTVSNPSNHVALADRRHDRRRDGVSSARPVWRTGVSISTGRLNTSGARSLGSSWNAISASTNSSSDATGSS